LSFRPNEESSNSAIAEQCASIGQTPNDVRGDSTQWTFPYRLVSTPTETAF